MLKKISQWLENKFEFTQDNFKRNWEKRNTDYKYLLNLWKWMTILAFFAGFTLAAGIYSQKVNNEVQAHIDNVNEYFFEKYGSDFGYYLEDHNITNNNLFKDVDYNLNGLNDTG